MPVAENDEGGTFPGLPPPGVRLPALPDPAWPLARNALLRLGRRPAPALEL